MSTESHDPSAPEARAGRSFRRLRALAMGLAVVAIASLVGNLGLIRASLRLYEREQDVRLDPIGLRVHAAERASASAARSKPLLAMFGDSRVAMWTTPSTLPDWDIVNLGISFQTSEQALLRFEHDVTPMHPSVVLFEVGVNDLKDLSTFPERRDEIVHACEDDIAALVAKARQGGASVVLATIFDLGDPALWRKPFFSPAIVATAIREVNVFIRTLAGDGVTIFETAPVLDDPPGKVRPSYQVDHLHVLPVAYEALNERLVPIVRAFRPSAR